MLLYLIKSKTLVLLYHSTPMASSSVPANDLPCNGDGVCMICNATPSIEEMLCAHFVLLHGTTCIYLCWLYTKLLNLLPLGSVLIAQSPPSADGDACPSAIVISGGTSDLIISIKAIETDPSLTDENKAKKEVTRARRWTRQTTNGRCRWGQKAM